MARLTLSKNSNSALTIMLYRLFILLSTDGTIVAKLKYRPDGISLRGDMIEVYKIIHNYYDTGASVKSNFDPVGSTRCNKFKLRKDMSNDIRKYSFCYRVVNVWKSLLDYMVEADSVNSFKSRLDKYWANQEFVFNLNSELIGTGGLPVCM